ncbi:MAG: biopolymer transporter ExbD [Deltaproteobacteria bacterium]|nr:biopolymer transporter ExbD [Deltaproteobacteria bacterium]
MTASSSSGTASSKVYSAEDADYVRRHRKVGHDLHQDEAMGELNIVPLLDILVNLIMFLLVSQATMISLGVIDVTAPSYAAAGPGGGPDENKPQLKLTLGVAKEGYFIAASGGVLDGAAPPTSVEITPDGVQKREPTIPLKPDGSYDYAALRAKLRSIKTEFPDARAVYFAADQSIPYNVVVKTLDASREDSRGPLFPAVAFSRIN